MIRSILTLLSCLLAAVAGAQEPSWVWARSAGSSGTENAFSIAARPDGSTYVTGQFGGPSITFGGTTLTNAGSLDIFVARYDAAGNVLWANRAGGPGFDGGLAIAADSAGNCYVTGSFENTVTFDTVTLTAAGAGDIFVAKYDASGNVLWAKRAGGAMIDGGSSIAVDRSGNCYVTGYYSSNFTLGSTALTNAGYEDLFLARYSPSGTVVWAKGIGGAGKESSTDIATDRSGNVYLTGWYGSSSLDPGGTILTNTGQNDVFIARYNPAGTLLWARNGGGAGSDQALSIAVDSGNNSYISGYYTAASVTFGAHTLTNAGGQDLFLVRYDSAGNALWAKGAGGTDDDLGYALATDANGYSYVAGWLRSSSITFGGWTLTNAGVWPYTDFFITRYNPSGGVDRAQRAGDAGMDVVNGIDLDGAGNCYVTGTFNTTIAFGSTTLSSMGGSDLFVAKKATGSTTVGEVVTAPGFTVFPNPVTDRLYIRCPDCATGKGTVEVFDVTGRLLLRRELTSVMSSIDVRQWPAGWYGIRVGEEWSAVVKQ